MSVQGLPIMIDYDYLVATSILGKFHEGNELCTFLTESKYFEIEKEKK